MRGFLIVFVILNMVCFASCQNQIVSEETLEKYIHLSKRIVEFGYDYKTSPEYSQSVYHEKLPYPGDEIFNEIIHDDLISFAKGKALISGTSYAPYIYVEIRPKYGFGIKGQVQREYKINDSVTCKIEVLYGNYSFEDEYYGGIEVTASTSDKLVSSTLYVLIPKK